MRFRVEEKMNDGLAEAPPYEIEVFSIEELWVRLDSGDTLQNDYGVPYGVGATLVVERVG